MGLTKATNRMITGASSNVLDFGAVGDGVTEDTAAIQACIDAVAAAGGGTVDIPNGTYITDTLRAKPNVDIYFYSGAWLKLKDSASGYTAGGTVYAVIAILSADSCENIKIINANLDGNRANQTPVGDGGHYGIYISHGDTQDGKITVSGAHIKNCATDGITVNSNSTKGFVRITDFFIDNSRRGGLSILQGYEIFISGGKIINSNGTAPEFGIDIESAGGDCHNITIDNVITKNNGGDGFVVGNPYTEDKHANIQFNNIKSIGDNRGFHATNASESTIVRGLQVYNSNLVGVWVQGGKNIMFDGIHVWNAGQTSTSDGITISANGAVTPENLVFDNIVIQDDQVATTTAHGINMSNGTNVKIGKVAAFITDAGWTSEVIYGGTNASTTDTGAKYSGNLNTIVFEKNQIAASTAFNNIPFHTDRAAGNNIYSFTAPFDGSVISFGCQVYTPITAGNLTAHMLIGSTFSGTLALDSTNSTGKLYFDAGRFTFNAGDLVKFQYSTDSGFLPTGSAAFMAWALIRYDD